MLPCGVCRRVHVLPHAPIAPIRSPAACYLAAVCRLAVLLCLFFRFFFVCDLWAAYPCPFPLCVRALSRGFLLLLRLCFTLLPACTHVTTALVIGLRLPSVLVSGLVRFRGHLLHLQAPTFCGFHPSEPPKRTPRYLGPLGCGKLQAQAQIGGCPKGSTGSNRGKKMTFLKNDPRSCATPRKVFLEHFELVVANFGTPRIPNCPENGLFWDQKWVTKGSKTQFS